MSSQVAPSIDPLSDERRSLTLGDYAQTVIAEQVRRILKREAGVLADKDPEHLHQMRVATRRLRTALQVFDCAIELPKAASFQQISRIAKVLGRLRDLDVQIAALQTDYYPQLRSKEQTVLEKVLDALRKQRRKTFTSVEDALQASQYNDLKAAYDRWLAHPRLKPLAQLPLLPLLPDLLTPLLSKLFLHSGWLISTDPLAESDAPCLHDLRKVCKHARYQAEFFEDFYGEDFDAWLEQIKDIQERLGTVQDGHVLLELLHEYGSDHVSLKDVRAIVDQRQEQALQGWDELRQTYLSPDFRRQMHQMIQLAE